MIFRNTVSAPQVDGGTPHRDKHGIHRRIPGHRGPGVCRATFVVFARLQNIVRIRITRVERPAQLAGDHVITTYNTSRHIGADVIRNAATNDNRRTRQRRGRRQHVGGI